MIESCGASRRGILCFVDLELPRGNAMDTQRWLRFLPGRSHLLLLAGAAAVVVFAFGFVDLTVTRQALQNRYDRAATRVERLEQQNVQLQLGLNRAQEGQNLPDRAWQYFGKVPRGASVIVVEPETASEIAPAAAQQTEPKPFWTDLWERLTQP